MKKLILAFLLISSTANAGIGVEHDGSGNIVTIDKSGSKANFTGTNKEYFTSPSEFAGQTHDDLVQILETVPRRYIKWNNGIEEMTAGEKTAVDTANAAIITTSNRSAPVEEVDAISGSVVKFIK